MSAEEDRKARDLVLAVLKHAAVAKISFTLNKRSVSPELYAKVAEAIDAGKITVLYAPALLPAKVSGRYYPVLANGDGSEFYDVLVLRFYALGPKLGDQITAAQLIVHECTHAGFDMLKLKKMTHLEHEAASYIAGARFAVEAMIAKRGDPAKVTFLTKLETAAWQIALKEAKGETVPKSLYNDLDVAISNDPEYKDEAASYAVNDGVGKPWKLKK